MLLTFLMRLMCVWCAFGVLRHVFDVRFRVILAASCVFGVIFTAISVFYVADVHLSVFGVSSRRYLFRVGVDYISIIVICLCLGVLTLSVNTGTVGTWGIGAA